MFCKFRYTFSISSHNKNQNLSILNEKSAIGYVVFLTVLRRSESKVMKTADRSVCSNCLLESANSEKNLFEQKSLDQTQDVINDNAFVAITNLLL